MRASTALQVRYQHGGGQSVGERRGTRQPQAQSNPGALDGILAGLPLRAYVTCTMLPCTLQSVQAMLLACVDRGANWQASHARLWRLVVLLATAINGLLLMCQVRLGEKETLESTLKFFGDRIERLSELEFYQVRTDVVSPCDILCASR